MPIREYFKGHGDAVMKDMADRYGAKKGKSVFYATANARKETPGGEGPKPRPPGESKVRNYEKKLIKGPLKENLFKR